MALELSGLRYACALGAQCGTLQDCGSSRPPWKILLSPLRVVAVLS